ncbi:MAG: VanZ family protein [Betaproteobacteria bacterium]
MSGSPLIPSVRYARSSRLVAYLAVAYLLLVVYASLYPFSGWRIPNADATRFLLSGWPAYVVASDVVLNVLAYVPLGLLLALSWMGRMPRWAATVLAVVATTLLSIALEFTQAYLPTRISSNVDVLTNSIGGLWGAVMAVVWGRRWLLSGDLHRLREQHFHAGARTDVIFVLIALWLATQLNADVWLFGNGDVRHMLPFDPGVQYSANTYLLFEAGVAALNFVGVAFLVGAVARSFVATAAALTVLMMTALLLKTIASMGLFIPGNPALWLTPGSVIGLVAGVMLWLPLAWQSAAASSRSAVVCICAAVLLVNLAPENPYLVAALQILQRGQFLHFNAMIGLLSSWWPFLAIVSLLIVLLRRAPRSVVARPGGAR